MRSFLDELRKRKDDRGMMANLRCILVENKKHRAWPVLSRIGVPIDDDMKAFVAGLYATYPDGDSNASRNFGVTCKAIERSRNEATDKDRKLTPTERRFQHLLAADRDEVRDRVMRMVLLAKSQGVAINYDALLHDLKRWDYARAEWAASFWTPGVPLADGEAA